MTFSYLLGILFAILASVFMNIGKGVQKRKVHVLRHGRAAFQPEHRPDLRIWLIGTAMLFSVPIPTSLALWLSGSPSLVSALTGVGTIALVAYSVISLGERLGWKEGVGIAAVSLGTTFLGAMGVGRAIVASDFDASRFRWAMLALLACGMAAATRSVLFKRHHGVSFGVLAGNFVGSSMFVGHVAILYGTHEWLPPVLAQLGTIYPYLALTIGTCGFVTVQLGLSGGKALEVVPAMNASIILTPLYYEWAVYGTVPSLARLTWLGLVVAGVVFLTMGQRDGEGAGEAEAVVTKAG